MELLSLSRFKKDKNYLSIEKLSSPILMITSKQEPLIIRHAHRNSEGNEPNNQFDSNQYESNKPGKGVIVEGSRTKPASGKEQRQKLQNNFKRIL